MRPGEVIERAFEQAGVVFIDAEGGALACD
jgi:hypothetical protein